MESGDPRGIALASAVILFVSVALTLAFGRTDSGTNGNGNGNGASTTTTPGGVTPVTPTPEFVRRPVTVDPATRLRDGDTVSVLATGFAPGEPVTIRLCASPPPSSPLPADYCDTVAPYGTGANADGVVEAGFTVPAAATTPALGTVECRRGRDRCSVGVHSLEHPDRAGWAVVNFDESVLPPPPARIAVDPSTNLRDGDTVTVTGRFFERDATVEVLQCPVDDDDGLCWGISDYSTEIDDDGTFAVDVPVWRLLDGDPGRPIDCAIPGSCEISVSGADPIAITFDPAGPLPPTPSITVTPNDGLRDGQVVSIDGTGFIPGVGLLVQQCVLFDGGSACVAIFDGGEFGTPEVTVAPDGSFHLSLRMHLALAGMDGFDCRAPASCVVSADPFKFTDETIYHAPLTPAPVTIEFE